MKALFSFAVASLLAAASGSAADVDTGLRQEATALSQTGGHRLRLTKAEQTKSPWDERVCAVTLHFRLEYLQGDHQFASQPPADVYLEAVGPLEEAILVSGENVATHKHSAWTDEGSSEVVIHTLEVGKEQKQMKKLKLALTLIRVTAWQQLEFKELKVGRNETLHCGPFEIDCTGEASHFGASASSRSEFAQEHENYRKQMPLGFANHRYAIEHARITDSRHRPLNSYSALGSGGSTSGRFSIQKIMHFGVDAEKQTDDQAASRVIVQNAEESIAYPVTLQLKLPKQYETERVSFEFEEVALPAFK